jgi:hypothetical protein
LTTLTESAIFAELRLADRSLRENLSAPSTCFAYPTGDVDARVAECVKQFGYRLAFTTVPGPIVVGNDPYLLPRTEISASDSLFVFKAKLWGALDWTRIKESPHIRQQIYRINQYLIRQFSS